MIKTYIAGVVLGVAGILAALHLVPVVDLDREISIIAVAPNGGNAEKFHINLPGDRIMAGVPPGEASLPAGLQWPVNPVTAATRAELFKVRNARETVIGVASRLVAGGEPGGEEAIEWVVHIPARGTLYVTLPTGVRDGQRSGILRAGTREFDGLTGSLSEQWLADTPNPDLAPDGRIELLATYIGHAAPADVLP